MYTVSKTHTNYRGRKGTWTAEKPAGRHLNQVQTCWTSPATGHIQSPAGATGGRPATSEPRREEASGKPEFHGITDPRSSKASRPRQEVRLPAGPSVVLGAAGLRPAEQKEEPRWRQVPELAILLRLFGEMPRVQETGSNACGTMGFRSATYSPKKP